MKHYGYGIVNKDGRPIATFVNTGPISGLQATKDTANRWSEKIQDTGAPFRAVELFYSDAQP